MDNGWGPGAKESAARKKREEEKGKGGWVNGPLRRTIGRAKRIHDSRETRRKGATEAREREGEGENLRGRCAGSVCNMKEAGAAGAR